MLIHPPPRVLITGAGAGVGRACADALAGRAELILCDNHAGKLAKTSHALAAVGRYCDVSSEASVAILAADILQRYSGLDMIVNAAGGGYERTLGMYRVSRALIPALKRGAQFNLLLNIPPSDADADAAIFPYASSRQAFRRLSTALAAETRGTSIHVLIACPKSQRISEVLLDRDANAHDAFSDKDDCDTGMLADRVAALVTGDAHPDSLARQAG